MFELLLFFFITNTLVCNIYSKIDSVKLWFTTMYLVDFYSVSNLIVILFNFLYPVFIMDFDCKSCVIERESVWRLKLLKTEEVFVGISQFSILQSNAYALHMIGIRRVSTDRDSYVLRVSRG